jgi:hypothetical protein
MARKRVYVGSLWISLAVTGSLFFVELYYSGGFPQGVPWIVFGALAVMAFVAASAFRIGLQEFAERKLRGTVNLVVATFALLAWITLFLDQLPCFIGGKGC